VTRDCALGYADLAHELGVDIGFHAADGKLFCHADPHPAGRTRRQSGRQCHPL
jgi:hypothetical protein